MQQRRVALSAELWATLSAYLAVRPAIAQTDSFFVSRTLRELTPRDAQRIVAEAARRAGITRKVTPHTLRHFFATRFLQKRAATSPRWPASWVTPTSARPRAICIPMRSGCRRWWRKCEVGRATRHGSQVLCL